MNKIKLIARYLLVLYESLLIERVTECKKNKRN